MADFVDQWLESSSYSAEVDIAPDSGDGVIDWFDIAVLVDNWLVGVE